MGRAILAVCSSFLAGLAALPAGAPAAGVGPVIRISERQEQRSCEYATRQGPVRERERYAAACRRVHDASPRALGATATYQNPVYDFSFPDPGVLQAGASDYYAYGTGDRFPVLHSTDLVNWEEVGQALPTHPSWAVATGDYHPWAPSVLRSPGACPGTQSPGCYLLYYVSLSGVHSPATNCVAVAWSPTPAGPFNDLGPIQSAAGALDGSGRPPGCGDDVGYSNIDPAPFVDRDGATHLYLSTDRRCNSPTTAACPLAPTVSVIRLTADLVRAAAPRTPLFGGTAGTWEQEPGRPPVVENPWVERRGSTYYLFYSGGDYRAAYGTGYATASSPTGPFTKAARNPILRQTAEVLGPGGGSVTKGPLGGDWLVYHGRTGSYAAPRTLRIDPLVWNGDGSVTVTGPTTGPQPLAVGVPDSPRPTAPPTPTPMMPLTPTPTMPSSSVPPPTRDGMEALLQRSLARLARDLRRLGIGGLVRRRGFTARGLDAPRPGRFSITLTGVRRGAGVARAVVLVKGSRSVSAAGRYALKVRLTSRGRRLLGRARRAKLRLAIAFREPQGRTATARRAIRLRR